MLSLIGEQGRRGEEFVKVIRTIAKIIVRRLGGGWGWFDAVWKGVEVDAEEVEFRSREVRERRVGLDVSCKLSAPWLAIVGGRISSLYLGKNLFFPCRAPFQHSLALSLRFVLLLAYPFQFSPEYQMGRNGVGIWCIFCKRCIFYIILSIIMLQS